MASYREEFVELTERREAANEKHVYFLLATAAAAIGLAVQRTYGHSLAWSQIPLALAVLSWGISFLSGCYLIKTYDTIRAVELIYLDHLHRNEGVAGPETKKARNERFDKLGPRMGFFWRWQFGALIAGAVFFLVWHVTEMALRTPAP